MKKISEESLLRKGRTRLNLIPPPWNYIGGKKELLGGRRGTTP